jgi:hypothetical protein
MTPKYNLGQSTNYKPHKETLTQTEETTNTTQIPEHTEPNGTDVVIRIWSGSVTVICE